MSDKAFDYTNEMAAYDLLMIDDFGLMELDMTKCRDLFEIIESLDNRKATMIISQLPVVKWWICLATTHTPTSASAG